MQHQRVGGWAWLLGVVARTGMCFLLPAGVRGSYVHAAYGQVGSGAGSALQGTGVLAVALSISVITFF